jgi:predicted transcriptional regulator
VSPVFLAECPEMRPTPLVFSVAPKWVAEILAGRKTFELRRRPPMLSAPVPAYLYETSPACQMRVLCLVGPTTSLPPDALWDELKGRSCVEKSHFDGYFLNLRMAHALEIRNVIDIGTGITLQLLREAGFTPPQNWSRAKDRLVDLVEAST